MAEPVTSSTPLKRLPNPYCLRGSTLGGRVGIAAAARRTKLEHGPNALRQSIVRAAALLFGCAAAFVCSRPSPLYGQQVALRSHAGPYLPTRISLKEGSLHVQQKFGFQFAAGLTLTFSDRFDVATGVTYIPGYAVFHGAGKVIQLRTGSHALTGSTGARYWLLPPGRVLSWEVHTGLGVAFGGQPAYEDLFESSTVSGIVGTMLRYQIGRIVRLQLRVQERLFRARFGAANAGSSRRPLQVTFGMAFPFLESLR
jgi:hypothetical protein